MTKVGARRDEVGQLAQGTRSPRTPRRPIQDNLANLGVSALDVVNLRVGGLDAPTPGSLAEPFMVLAEMQKDRA